MFSFICSLFCSHNDESLPFKCGNTFFFIAVYCSIISIIMFYLPIFLLLIIWIAYSFDNYEKKIATNILVHLLMDISTHSPLGMELLDHLSLYICLDLANIAKLFFKVFVPKFWSLGQPTLAPTSDFPPDQPACVALWIYPCHSFCINTCPNSKFSHFGFIEL